MINEKQHSICDRYALVKEYEDIICSFHYTHPGKFDGISFHHPDIFSHSILNGFSHRYDHALKMACTVGNLDLLVYLVSNDLVNPSINDNNAIITTSRYGYTELVRFLLKDRSVDPSDGYNAPIHFAAKFEHYETIKILLLDPRVDPYDKCHNAICDAASSGNLKVLKLLLTGTHTASRSYSKALIKAAENGHL